MFNKWKEELKEKVDKLKKKTDGDDVSDSVSNASQPNQPAAAPQQVAFNLNNMNEFSHEELQ